MIPAVVKRSLMVDYEASAAWLPPGVPQKLYRPDAVFAVTGQRLSLQLLYVEFEWTLNVSGGTITYDFSSPQAGYAIRPGGVFKGQFANTPHEGAVGAAILEGFGSFDLDVPAVQGMVRYDISGNLTELPVVALFPPLVPLVGNTLTIYQQPENVDDPWTSLPLVPYLSAEGVLRESSIGPEIPATLIWV